MTLGLSGTDDQGPWPLNETTPITIRTGLLAGAGRTVERLRMKRALEQENQPVVMRMAGAAHSTAGIGLLPAGMHLLSFYVRLPREGDTALEVVIQLQNIVEHSAPAVLTGGIAALLPAGVSVETCTETTLTLQQPLAENHRLTWIARDGVTSGTWTQHAASDCVTGSIVVGALDIRSFVLTLKNATN